VHEPAQFIGTGVSSHPFDRLRASLKLARTIADLAGCEEIQSVHLAEALQYRPKLLLN
jgi:magnesium chelatase family protein